MTLVLVFRIIRWPAAWALFWSFLCGESAAGYWTHMGVGARWAIAITIVCSSCNIAAYFVSMEWWKNFSAETAACPDASRKRRFVHGAVSAVCAVTIPQFSPPAALPERWTARIPEYGLASALGSIPGGMGVALGYAFGRKLNPAGGACAVICGNAVKMVACGLATINIPGWAALSIFFLVPLAVNVLRGRGKVPAAIGMKSSFEEE